MYISIKFGMKLGMHCRVYFFIFDVINATLTSSRLNDDLSKINDRVYD